MKIAVWGPYPKHEIARTVADVVLEGLEASGYPATIYLDADEVFYDADIHIGYGILRGIGDVFKEAQKRKQPFFLIDRGYFLPGHYSGYYRISLRGTQQTFGLDKLKPDYERWDALGLEVLPAKERRECILVCPPTKPVMGFFNTDWQMPFVTENIIYRDKRFQHVPIQEHLDGCNKVLTFNSSVGWEALRQGIPVVSDPTHSIVGAYQKMLDKSIHDDSNARRELFSLMASLQLTLAEVRQGQLWPVIQNLLNI